MTDTLTLTKLIILYMLNKVDFTLTNSQISEFILDKDYINYFMLQQALNELEQADFIRTSMVRNSSHYTITNEGRSSLSYFGNQISEDIIHEIDEFMVERKYQLREENEITADYYREQSDVFIVRCQLIENGEILMDLHFTVNTEQQAITICDNWKKKNVDVYDYMVHSLFIK